MLPKPTLLPLDSVTDKFLSVVQPPEKLLSVPKRKYGLASPVPQPQNLNLNIRAQRKWSAPPLGGFRRKR